MSDKQYKDLIREARHSMYTEDIDRRKRRRRGPLKHDMSITARDDGKKEQKDRLQWNKDDEEITTEDNHLPKNERTINRDHSIEDGAEATSDNDLHIESDEFEDVDLGQEQLVQEPSSYNNKESPTYEVDQGSELDHSPKFLFDEDAYTSGLADEESITVTIDREKNEPKTKRTKQVSIDKEERDYRRLMHMIILEAMLVHGSMRNQWCSDYQLLKEMKRHVPLSIVDILKACKSPKLMNVVKSRKLLDAINQLANLYSSKFRLSAKGLIRKNWNELSEVRSRSEKFSNVGMFKKTIMKFSGSRDAGAQGFVAMLRSIGLNARLVFSIQVPDYSSITPYPKSSEENSFESQNTYNNVSGGSAKTLSNKASLLDKVRKESAVITNSAFRGHKFEDSEYPIFWTEVWNSYSKRWVSVDPVVLKTVEIPPMRRKSKFQPPTSEERNQLTYAIAYDAFGGVKDVTRRYSHYYNARTVKKKISFRSEEDEHWYERLIRAVNFSPRYRTKADILETKEFHDRDLAEGMPNSMADFKNHPLYALESQLRQNEVIFPKDNTSKCGSFRTKVSSYNKKTDPRVLPVFKRSHVYTVRSAKAWYMRGRVLKFGAQPLKVKGGNDAAIETEDDDDSTRLYAIFQTKMYTPKPIIDGKITKNAFGSIDIYTPSMIPENGYLIDTMGAYNMKLAEKAAKSILGIDYAKAVVGFDFGGTRKRGRNAVAKEGGLLIDEQYKEAMLAVMDALVEEEKENEQRRVELNALKNWKNFLIRLRISEKLNKEHGSIEQKANTSRQDNQSDELDRENLSNMSDDSDDDNEDGSISPGGFFVGTRDAIGNLEDNLFHVKEDNISDDEEKDEIGGGFFVEDGDNYDVAAVGSQPGISSLVSIEEGPGNEFPDFLFREDENGELLYDPQSAYTNSTEDFMTKDVPHVRKRGFAKTISNSDNKESQAEPTREIESDKKRETESDIEHESKSKKSPEVEARFEQLGNRSSNSGFSVKKDDGPIQEGKDDQQAHIIHTRSKIMPEQTIQSEEDFNYCNQPEGTTKTDILEEPQVEISQDESSEPSIPGSVPENESLNLQQEEAQFEFEYSDSD